jgi:hypothetical protein
LTHACITIDPDGLAIALYCSSSGYVQGGVGDMVHEFMATPDCAASRTPQELATALLAWMNRESGSVPPEYQFDDGMTSEIGHNEYDYTIKQGPQGWEIDVFPEESLGEPIVHPRQREFVRPQGRKGQKVVLTGKFPGVTRAEAKARFEGNGAKVVEKVDKSVSFVVAGEQRDGKPSSKVLQAQALGINVISANQVYELNRTPSGAPQAHSAHTGTVLVELSGESFRFFVNSGGEPADFGEALINWLASDVGAMCEGGMQVATQLVVDLNHPDECPPRIVYDPDDSLSAGTEFNYSIVEWSNPKDRYDYGIKIGEYPDADELGQVVVHPDERAPEELPEPSELNGSFVKIGGEIHSRVAGDLSAFFDQIPGVGEELEGAVEEPPAPATTQVRVELKGQLDDRQALEAIGQVLDLAGVRPATAEWAIVLDEAWDEAAEGEWPRVIGGFQDEGEIHAWLAEHKLPGSYYTVTITPKDEAGPV